MSFTRPEPDRNQDARAADPLKSEEPIASIDPDDYVFETLCEDSEFRLSRGYRAQSQGTILAITPVLDRPAASTLARMRRSVSLHGELAAVGAFAPLALVHHEGRPMMLATDPGGVMLPQLIGRPIVVGRFLRVAIGVLNAVGQLHSCNLVHRDIKPTWIMVDETTGKTVVGGSGLSLRISRHRQASEPPSVMVGTLPYMAPEQTGRMNRPVDFRSDLYGCGVTLYELCTGERPFTSTDPRELIHCHLARQPVPPSARVEGLPEILSSIILKLLAKTPEDRYQSARGVELDLRRCLAEWEAWGRIEPFALGERDLPDQLIIPDKLYGRDAELGMLQAELASACSGASARLVLVSAQSGMGKSSLVNELRRDLSSQPGGLFVSGKAEEYGRGVPFATLASALRNLVGTILSGSESELNDWRRLFVRELGASGQLLVSIVPELERIIGAQPPMHDLPARDAEIRFQTVIQRFIGLFASAEHPLVLFLDDLQWIDQPTLDLIGRIMSDGQLCNLLLVGAYRDNEVDSTHPLMRCREAIRSAHGAMREIALPPLAAEAVTDLVADFLRCPRDRARSLAQLVHDRTAGNPLFVVQFLFALADEQLLVFDPAAWSWTWDVAETRAKRSIESVVDLMREKAARLAPDAQESLKMLACLGNAADPATLAVVREASETEVHASFAEAAQAELVYRRDTDYRFPHDRVREAAYALIPEGERAAVHLRIGRLLAAHTPATALRERVFEIVRHLNRGASLVTDRQERERIAALNLVACKNARLSASFASALTYAVAGEALLTEETWQHDYELAFGLAVQRAECELHLGNLDSAEQRLAMLAERATSLVDRTTTARLRMGLYTTRNRPDRAVEIGLGCLAIVGIVWPTHPTEEEVQREYDRMWRLIGDRSIESLLSLPTMRDPGWRAILDDILLDVLAPALFTDRNLFLISAVGAVNMALEHGSSNGSAWAYVVLGMVLGSCFGDHRNGVRFGRLGVALSDTQGYDRFKARVHMTFGHHIIPWSQHIRTGETLINRAFETMLNGGELTFLAYSRNHMITHLFTSGESLVEVEREAESGLRFAQKANFPFVADDIVGALALIRSLRGLTRAFGFLNTEDFDEGRYEQRAKERPSFGSPVFRYWVRKLIARFHAGDCEAAAAAAAEAKPMLWSSPRGMVAPWFLETAEYHFFGALAMAGCHRGERPAASAEELEELRVHQEWLTRTGQTAPENFAGRAALVSAEIARLGGEDLAAERLYEAAVASAREHGFVHVEAIAHESAGHYYAARGLGAVAEACLHNARDCYARWGADGKVRQLDEAHPEWSAVRASGTSATLEASAEQLDLATVLEASQAVSSEIVLDKMIHTLMTSAVEHAGAQRALLLLARGEELHVEAEAITGREGIEVRVRPGSSRPSELPGSVLHYAARTRQSVLIDDASAPNQFAADDYIVRHRCRSILCLPLVKQTELIGVLYLENNLASRTFTPQRSALLQLVASHAAVSLDHARLFSELAQENADRRNAEVQLEQRLGFERLIADLSADIAQSSAHSLDSQIHEWLARIATLLEIDRAAFFEYVPESSCYRVTASWCAESPRPFAPVDGESVPAALEHMRNNEPFCYDSVEEMPATERRLCVRSGIRSAVGIPASVEGVGLGYLILAAIKGERHWSPEVVQRLGVVADIFANAVARKHAERDRKVQQELTQALEFRELIMGILSHDLRSPLGAASGLAQLLMRHDGLPDDVVRRVAALYQSLERMNDLITTILDFTESRFTGVMTIARTATDLAEVCARVVNEQLATSPDRSILVRSDGDTIGQWDPVRMEQVVSNLLSNALTHGDHGKPVGVRLQGGDGEMVLEVTNHGAPIAPDVLGKLFEPFRRGPTAAPGHGLGLGLYIVRQIARAHGGSVAAQSTLEQGTVFAVRLPRSPVA